MASFRRQKPLADVPLRNTDRYISVGMKINVITLCSGYDAMTMGLKRLKKDYPQFDFELLAWSEIADAPIKAHKACHPESADRNLGDMSQIDWKKWNAENGNPNIDLLFYSTPCTSVSIAGKNKGAEEGSGTESALIWYTKHAIRELHPRILICENVKGMVSGKNLKTFHKWQHELESYGYTNFTSILDARDYGVAQHRERLFMVSILDCTEKYYFPKPFKLEKRLKDYLEKDVPESYYLKPEQVVRIVEHCDKKQAEGCGFKTQFATEDCSVAAITGRYGQRETDPYVQEKGVGISIHPLNRKMEFNGYRSVRFDVAPTLTAHDGKGGEPCVWEVEPTIQPFGSYVPSSTCGGKIVKADSIAPTVMENYGNVTAIAEPQIIQLFQLYPDSDNTQVGRVYDTGGIYPTLSTACGGHHEPKILTQVRTEEAKELRRKGIEVFAHRQLEPRTDDCCGTITTVQKDYLLQEPISEANATPDPSVWVDNETNKAYYYKDGCLWRIRKLMPSECLRLMDVSEEDIQTICSCGVSKTGIYSLAGNSICVGVLTNIFKKLFIDKSNPNQQLTLF